MGRSKIKHEFISNGSARRATYKKRKAGLLKKLSELTTLCGVPACAVIYSAYDSQAEIWPSPQEATQVLEMFKTLPSEKQDKYMMDQEAFLEKQIAKAEVQLEKERKKVRGLLTDQFIADIFAGKDMSHMSIECLIELDRGLEEKIELVNRRIEFLESAMPAKTIAEDDDETDEEKGEA